MNVDPLPRPGFREALGRLPVLPLVVMTVFGSLLFGLSARASCVGENSDPGKGLHWCETQLPPLLVEERLTGERLPYLDACSPLHGKECDEYPVLTMYAMRSAASVSEGPTGFYYVAVILLSAAAVVTALCLWSMVGVSALYFTAAPTLMLFGFMNWDLLGVVFLVGAVFAHVRRRDVVAGIWIGLGTAVKLFPALLLLPFVVGRFREGRRREAGRLVLAALLVWTLVNAPFALAAWDGWSHFFAFNAGRPVDIDSVWSIACRTLVGHTPCGSVRAWNAVSLLLWAAALLVVWRMKVKRDPGTPLWAYGFPVMGLFFLTSKVYSPQYDLWLLPWFALALPELPLFLMFQVADVAILLTRYSGFGEAPVWAFQGATLARDAILVMCLVAFVRRPWNRYEPERTRTAATLPGS